MAVTPHLTVRIPLALRKAAQDKARAEGKTLTEVVIRALERYVKH